MRSEKSGKMEYILRNVSLVAEKMLLYLDLEDVQNCRRVSKSFVRFIDSNEKLWRSVIMKKAQEPYVSDWKKIIKDLEIEYLMQLANSIGKIDVKLNYCHERFDRNPIFYAFYLGNLEVFIKFWKIFTSREQKIFPDYASILKYFNLTFDCGEMVTEMKDAIFETEDVPFTHIERLYLESMEIAIRRNRIENYLVLVEWYNEKRYLYTTECSPLYLTAQFNNFTMYKFVFAAYRDKNPQGGRSMLYSIHHTVMQKNFAFFKFIFDHVEDKFPQDLHGNTPMELAIVSNQEDIVRYTLENAKFEDSQITPILQLTIRFGKIRMFKLIFDFLSANYPSRFFEEAMSFALHESIKRGVPLISAIIIERVNIIAARNIHGHSPLHTAAIAGNIECGKLIMDKLRENGGNKHEIDYEGFTPFDLAKKMKRLKMIDLLTLYDGEKDIYNEITKES